MLPRVAIIGTGGTISGMSQADGVTDRLDLINYGTSGQFLRLDALLETVPELARVADIVPVHYNNINSTHIGPKEWLELLNVIHATVAADPGLAGVVLTHGTATLEETAYFLNLTVKVPVPVVVVGAMRPASALGADGGLNLLNAVCIAGCPEARGMGVLVALNDEIHAARDVTKTSNFRVHTFATRDYGMLGTADGDGIFFYRKPIRTSAPDTEFDVAGRTEFPRVDIIPAYAGADASFVHAALQAGAKGLVSAGFPAGSPSPLQREALVEAARAGIIVVQSSRASGRVAEASQALRRAGFLGADNLTPQKARILLMLALTVTIEPDEIRRIFATY